MNLLPISSDSVVLNRSKKIAEIILATIYSADGSAVEVEGGRWGMGEHTGKGQRRTGRLRGMKRTIGNV